MFSHLRKLPPAWGQHDGAVDVLHVFTRELVWGPVTGAFQGFAISVGGVRSLWSSQPLFHLHQIPPRHTGEEDERVAAAAMKELEMLMPNVCGMSSASG